MTTSATNSAKTVDYTYDDLNRLTTASTTNAVAGSNYSYAYTYDAIGNIASSTESGAYTYAGTAYANPHAVTTIGSTTYAHDNNGNLTSKGAWTYAWDYQNRMISAGNGTATSTYAYDYTGQRVSQTAGGITTVYPTKYYNATTATSTKHIFTPSGELIATVVGNGTATTTQHLHTDHLGGTGVVTDSNGNQVEMTDYYPYGDARLNEGTFNEQRKYTGHEYDNDTALTYANARYYDQGVGRFNSQDPVFREVGSNKFRKEAKGSVFDAGNQQANKDLEVYVSNPQLANAYSYAANNPLRFIDETGKAVFEASFGFTAGLAGLNIGLRIDPRVGWQVFSSNSLGVGFGFSVQYDAQGTLDETRRHGEVYVERSYSFVPIIGRWGSTQAGENLEKPWSLEDDPKKSSGWGFGLEFGYSHAFIRNGAINYFDSYNGPSSNAFSNSSIAVSPNSVVNYAETGQFLQRTLDEQKNKN